MSQRLTKEHKHISPFLNPSPCPPLQKETEGGKVPSPLLREGLGEGYFRVNTIMPMQVLLILLQESLLSVVPQRRISAS